MINFETDFLVKKGETYDVDELETKIVGFLNETRISLNNIREVYEVLEDALFDQGVTNIEEESLQKLNDHQKALITDLFCALSPDDRVRVTKVARGMILRLLVGSTNDKIWSTELGMSMQYSDVLHEDEELNENFVDSISANGTFQMRNLVDILNLITST